MKIFKLCYIIFLVVAQNASAEYCKDFDFEKVIPKFRAEAVDQLHACKVMPNFPEKAIVAYLAPDEGASLPDSASNYNLEIFIIETKTNSILKHLHDGKLDFAIYYPVEITIDVAKYNLSKIQRAFGIRMTTHLSSRLVRDYEQWLNLYIENQDGLVNVLKGFNVHNEVGRYHDSCEYEGETQNKALSMLTVGNDGFANIEVTSEVKTLNFKIEGNECKQQPSKTTISKSTLKYFNGTYK